MGFSSQEIGDNSQQSVRSWRYEVVEFIAGIPGRIVFFMYFGQNMKRCCFSHQHI